MKQTAVNYDHSKNHHTTSAAEVILPHLLSLYSPRSILDVGCGKGTWLQVASKLGAPDLLGIDGIDLRDKGDFQADVKFRQVDFRHPWNLNRKFDLALCLEVAEHLPEASAASFISSITQHADTVVFSAAIPNQPGYEHINCQWPAYWQGLFNNRKFACYDLFRMKFWEDQRVDPWYRQNLFLASFAPEDAGHEPRLVSLIHPELYDQAIQYAVHAENERSKKETIDHFLTGKIGLRSQLQCAIAIPRGILNSILFKLRSFTDSSRT